MKENAIAEALSPPWPMQLGLIVTRRAADGLVDIMPAGWLTQTSTNPTMFAVAVNHVNYTNQLIRQSGEFTICYPSEGMAQAVWFCGTHSARDADKSAAAGLALAAAKHLQTPLLAHAYAALECRLTGLMETGDHTLFAAEVLTAWASEGVEPLKDLGEPPAGWR
jgi:flavin reductase (DIM6/NTAB) family NADH-FMN oxidoreductase RutF